MPAGISEGLIRRAFAPIDLSYAYQRLDATQRILNAEDRALKQQAQKDYYTELASIKKDLGGVRSEDIAEISKKYKQWADISRQLAANPRLITRNPDKYGELKSQADTLYGETLKDIEESKEMKKLLQATTEKLGDVRNFDLLDEGAYEKFKQNALFRPTKELVQSGAYSFNKYLSPIVDGKAFFDAAQKDINDKAIIKEAQIEDIEYKDQYGRKKFDKVKNVPIDVSIYNIAVENLGRLKNRANTFAQQRLDELVSSGEDQKILKEYKDFYEKKNKGFEKYLDAKNMLVYDTSASPKDRYAKLYAMSEFLDRARTMTKEVGQPTRLDEIKRMQLQQMYKGGEEETETEEVVDLWTPALTTIQKVHSNPKFANRNVTLESFDDRIQNQALTTARNTLSPSLVMKDLALNYNPSKESIQIFSRVKIDDLKVKPGDYIGEMSKQGLFIKGNAPAGQKYVREAIRVAGKTTTPKKSGKKKIIGF